MKLQGKTALVTGGALRIGRAICEGLAEAGCNVIVHFHHSGRCADGLVKRLRRKNIDVCAVQGDLQYPEQCLRVMNESLGVTGRLDILVNNAAIFRRSPLRKAAPEEIRLLWQVNLMAPMMLMQAFAGRVKSGRIVNLLDQRIRRNDPTCIPYLLTKKALADLTEMAALAFAPTIAVNGVAPGAILSPPSSSGRRREKAGVFPLGYRPPVADVVKAVLFLLQMDSITGQIVFVDSGQHLVGGDS